MAEVVKDAVLLDNWIKTQASKYAYNEKTSGFIGKKCLKERVLSAVPREFIVLGHTREKVTLRLNELLANDLTQTLIRDCDKRRIKSSQPEPSLFVNRLNPVTGDKGVSTTGFRASNTLGAATRGLDVYPSLGTPGASTNIVHAFGLGTGAAATGNFGSRIGTRGASVQDNAPDKGKKPINATTEDESEDYNGRGMHAVVMPSALDDKSNQYRVPTSPVSDVDRAIADFVENNLPNARIKTASKPAAVGDPGDIFSRRGSSPQRYFARRVYFAFFWCWVVCLTWKHKGAEVQYHLSLSNHLHLHL